MSSTATLQQKPAEKVENGVPVAARQAPVPAPIPVDDEDLRKEAAAAEQEEESLPEQAVTEPPEPEEEDEEDMVGKRLFGAVQEITEEIEDCQKRSQKANEIADKLKEEAEAEHTAKLEKLEMEYTARLEKIESDREGVVEEAEARAEELKAQTSDWFTKMQSTFGVTPKQVRRQAAKSAKVRNGKNGKPVRALVLEYLEKHRHARTSEIKSFLLAQGRTTNPGVELSRMVKDKSIVNSERGMYTLGKAHK